MRSMTVERDGDSLIVVFLDRNISDEVRIMEIGDDLTGTASKLVSGQAIVLDFRNVEYVSSAMVGQLVQLRKATEGNGVAMTLRNISPTTHAILQAMHLDKVFRVESDDA